MPEDMGREETESTHDSAEEMDDLSWPGTSRRPSTAVPSRPTGDPAMGIAAAEEPSGPGTSCRLAAAVPRPETCEPAGAAAGTTPEPAGSEAKEPKVVMVMVATQTDGAALETGGAAPADPAPTVVPMVRLPRRVWVTMHGGCYHLEDCPCLRNRIGVRTYSFCTRCG